VFGMFSPSAAILPPPPSDLPNSAKDVLDDILGEADTGDETFATTPGKQFTTVNATPVNGKQVRFIPALLPSTQSSSTDTRDTAIRSDTTAETMVHVQKRRGRPTKAERQKLDADLPVRRSARNDAILQSVKNTTCTGKRTGTKKKPKAAKIEGSVWVKPEPAAAKPKAPKPKVTKRILHTEKRGLRLRNYRGELIDDEVAIIEIADDEVEDVEEFARYDDGVEN
jgi:hypothetical protein